LLISGGECEAGARFFALGVLVPTHKNSVSVQLKNVVMVGVVLVLVSLVSKSAAGPFGDNLRPGQDAPPASEDSPDKQGALQC
jgi:hypothetical protein